MAQGYASGVGLSTDATLGGGSASDGLVPSQKAVRTYTANYAQPLDSGLTSLTAADASAGLPYVTGANTWAGATLGDLAVSGGAWTVTQARGLRETSGPTTLTVGAIADGQTLKRSGSSIVGAWVLLAVATSGDDPIYTVGTTNDTITGIAISTGTLV